MYRFLNNTTPRLIRALRTQAGMIVLIFFVVLIHGGYHLIFQKTLAAQGLPYYPMLMNMDERRITAAHANKVFRSGAISGDINFFENRDAPYMVPPIPDLIMGYLSRVLGSLKAGFIAADSIFPAVSFFLLYLVGFELTRAKTFATLFASAVFFIPRAFLYFPLLTRYYQAYTLNHTFNLQGRLYFDRFEDPLLTAPFFFLALYLLLRSLTREERWMPVLAGISAGLLFYVYFYYMVYFFTGLGVMALIVLLQKNNAGLKKIIIVGAVGLAASSFYWINFLALTHLPTYTDIISHVGPEHGYAPFFYLVPVFAYVQHTALAIILYLLLRRESPMRAAYMVGILLPVFIIYNFQIVTGFNPQPDHWIKPRQFILTLAFLYLGFLMLKNHPRFLHAKYLLPAALLPALFLLWKGVVTKNGSVRAVSLGVVVGMMILGGTYALLKRKVSLTPLRFAGILSLAVIVVLCVKGFLIAKAFTEKNIAAATIPPTEDASYRWLNTHTPPGSVVGSISAITNTNLQLFTANTLFAPMGLHTIISNRELLARFMALNRLWGVDPDAFGSYFPTEETYPPKDEDHSVVRYLFGGQYLAKTPGSIFGDKGTDALPPSPKDYQRLAIEEYRRIVEKTPVSLPYELDYLYDGPRERLLAPHTSFLSSFEKIYDAGGIRIYTYSPAEKN